MAKKKKKAVKEKKPVKKKSKPKKSKSKKKVKRGKRKKKGGSGLLLVVVVIAVIGVIAFSKMKQGVAVKNIKAQKAGEWGSPGNTGGKLNSPRGIAVSNDGFVYVSDLNNSRFVKYTKDGKFIGAWGEKGEKKGEFREPSGIAVDTNGNVYVADSWNGRIQKFSPEGKYLLEIGGQKAGFYSPRNVAVNMLNMVFVADTGTSRVHRFDMMGNRVGNPVGGTGKGLDKFQEVFGITFDSQGRIYVADAGNKRVVVMSPQMKPEAQIRIKAWENNSPLWPMIAMDTNDRLYCVSSGTKEIWVYDAKDPKFKYTATIGLDRSNKPLFNNPLGIAIDRENVVYVTEVAQNKIMKIKPVFLQ